MIGNRSLWDEWDVRCAVCGSAAGRPCYGNGDMPRGSHGRREAARRSQIEYLLSTGHEETVRADELSPR